MSLPLLEQVLAEPSEDGRRRLLEGHNNELPALLSQWSQLAWEASRAGDHEQALAIQELLLFIFSMVGHRDLLAPAWGNYGHLLLVAERPDTARQSWQHALELYGQPPPNLAGRADMAINLGTSYWQASDFATAMSWLQSAIVDYEQLPHSLSTGFAYTRLGDSQQALGQLAEALT